MPRGRLIFPFATDLGVLDTVATEEDPDGAGPLDYGYDDVFREPVIVPPATGSGKGTKTRAETIVQAKAQIEPESMEALEMMATGRAPTSQVVLIYHFKDLEALGLVDTTNGEPTIRIGTRLDAIRNHKSLALILKIRQPPGLYATEVQSRGFGLGPHRNLLLVRFEERSESAEVA